MLWLTSLILLVGSIVVLVFFTNREGFLDLSPTDSTLDAMRKPYALLSMETKPFPQVPIGPTSQQCYEADYEEALSLVPSYRQMTNNYKHKNGESCSAPNHDLILGIYA